jgi:uncharacterized protein (TIGR02466 family)
MTSQIHALFAVPVLHVQRAVDPALIGTVLEDLRGCVRQSNDRSRQLVHTAMLSPARSIALQRLAQVIEPHLVDFGAQLFGQRLVWTIKEMWLNLLDTGGGQRVHNHANSFVSGVIYLTPTHASSNTVFIKSVGGSDWSFSNSHAASEVGPYNAGKWVAPDPEPGDLLLFPSYLLHEVPENQGGLRITLAFNAIPDQLDAWGYRIRFGV